MTRAFLPLCLAALSALLVAAVRAQIAPPPDVPEMKSIPDFGKDVKLAPFVVRGEKLSISIHARTKADRSYATEFAEEVVKVAFETMDKSTGAGLVIVGREGEPHPIVMMKRLLAMADAGHLDPQVAAKAREINARLDSWKAHLNMDKPREAGDERPNISFEMVVPALPVPLEGTGAKLYQIAWAEKFDEAKIAARMRTLTLAELESNAFAKYDWVFYLPPRSAAPPVINAVLAEVMKHEKMGLFKRVAIRGALLVFKPAIKKSVEAMRKGMLYMTVLHARSGWGKEDIKALTGAYVQVMMPDFKFNDSDDATHARVMDAIEKQKRKNEEYAKDPYVTPARLATFEAAAYERFVGEYGRMAKIKDSKLTRSSRALLREGDAWLWRRGGGKPVAVYPAGERLFVAEDGKFSVEFKVDAAGVVTGAEERRVRYRETFSHPPTAERP